MTYLFIASAVLTVLALAASAMYWSLHAATGEDIPRQRATGFFRWAVVIVLATFNIWIFTRVGGAIKDIWFPSAPPPPPPALIDGQLPGRPPPEETQPKN
ncbi:MAG TPA: hypothetical protein VMT14_00785 [Burkholderiaceae bacterium]|jgi:hypothetical protein|nr:hypothetical protein [Burkholderiaceae bacterium]